MEEKKTRGRPVGINKSVKILGYKYTPEEAAMMEGVLNDLRGQGMTTSKALLTIFQEYKNKIDKKKY